MKITVLVDNNSRIDNYLLSEPSYSVFIEIEDKKILFDSGYSDVLIKNAKALNIDLSALNYIAISHGHNDHTGGLKYLPKNKNTKLIAHPRIFDEKSDENNIQYGCPITKDELQDKFSLNLTKNPSEIVSNLYFLGEIENNKSEDIDDTALAYKTSFGLIIITGCSHSGIINIIRQAKKVTLEKRVFAIFGGLHLMDKSVEELKELGEFFKSENINKIYPCHCCNLNSKIVLSEYSNVIEVCTGDSFNFN